jgi:hypothetical protein
VSVPLIDVDADLYGTVSSTSTTNAQHEPPIESQGPRVVTPLGFRPNAYFVGFHEELRKLHRRLRNTARQEVGTSAILVWGEVGSGKTYLARQYFYKQRQEYPEGVFWIDCKTRETISKGLWDIGVSIGALEQERDRRSVPPGPDDFADTVRQQLETMHGWLLVFDGIFFETEESLDAFRKYIPDARGNCIIFTSVDRTLAHRHRLLNPTALKVGKLSVSDATDLLYQNLNLRHPSTLQQEKALELVKDNDYLPLAIYAAAHALIERGKSLERYTHTPSDLRLITPFLDILAGLRDQGRDEAVNLVNLLSFFTHTVPVALIRYGYKSLASPPFNIDILSPKYAQSTRRDLDSTISILLRSGLLERTLQTWSRSSGSSSPEETRSLKRGLPGQRLSRTFTIKTLENTPPSQLAEDSSGLDDLVVTRMESRGTRSSKASTQSVVDTLKIHTVVQNVVRDDLKEKPLMGEHDYWWWLEAAVRLLTQSYAVANEKMRKASGAVPIRDYREYEAQAARMLSFFPRSSTNATAEMRQARHDIRGLLKVLKREIQNQSPSSASDSSRRQFLGSIFERSSSTSEGTQSPSLHSLSPASTWSLEPERATSESPVQMHTQLHQSVEDSQDNGLIASHSPFDSALVSDDESWPAISDTTEVPNHTLSPHSRRSSILHAVLEGKPRIKPHKDLGEWKELPVHGMVAPPSVSHPEIQMSHAPSRTSSETRSSRPSSSSEAEAALAAMHRTSPPAPRGGGRLRSTSRGSSDRPPLAHRSPNTGLSPLAGEFQPGIIQAPLKAQGPSKLPHQRNLSSSPRLVQALLTNQANSRARSELPPLQIDQISLLYPSRTEEQHASYKGPSVVNNAVLPNVKYLPTGYTSVPMSRDTSRDSDTLGEEPGQQRLIGHGASISGSAPLRALSDPYILGVDAPGTYGFNLQDSSLRQSQNRQQLTFGKIEEWASIQSGDAAHGSGVLDAMTFEKALSRNQSKPRDTEALRFGYMDPVNIEEARERVSLARERSEERTRGRSRAGQGGESQGRSR